MSTTLWPMRVFCNRYVCEECDVRWSDILLTKGQSWCPACDATIEPYASDEIWEECERDEEDMLWHCN